MNKPVPIRERLLRWSSPEPNTGCWLWMGVVGNHGYGVVSFTRKPKTLWALAHRLSYEEFIGPIPKGLHIDHLCRVRCCINPQHLEPVTCAENLRRGIVTTEAARKVMLANKAANPKTHCPHGHEFTVENTRIYKGHRHCRACQQYVNRAMKFLGRK